MKVLVTASGPSMDAAVDPRFGRCPYFVLVETGDMSSQALENPGARFDSGAGVQAARFVAEGGFRTVLTGACGPKAAETLAAAGVTVFTGCSGTLSDAVEDLQAGRLDPATV